MTPQLVIAKKPLPSVPPNTFEQETVASRSNWSVTRHSGIGGYPLSSGQFDSKVRVWLFQLQSAESTASRIDRSQELGNLVSDAKAGAIVNPSNATSNVFELRRLTGFTWSRLANLLNVDRRTLNNWVRGGGVREQNRAHIAKTLEVMRVGDRGSSKLNAAALDERCLRKNQTPFQAIRSCKYEDAKEHLSPGFATRDRLGADMAASLWIGEFQPFGMHDEADGTETFQSLPDVPEPVHRKRPIKRV